MNNFTIRVQEIVKKITRGEVRSYKEVATEAGNPLAARAVANIMAKNYIPDIPCHRVIRSDGTLGGYNRGGEKAKKHLLAGEGIVI